MTVFPSLHFQHTTDLKHHWRTPAQLECCCSKYLLLHVHIYNFKTLVAARGHSRHTQQPQPQAPKQQTDMNFEEFLPYMQAQSHNTRYLAVEQPQVTQVKRIGPVLFCAACSSVAAITASNNTKCGLLTIWHTMGSSLIQKWQDELTCIKSEKLSWTWCTSTYKPM